MRVAVAGGTGFIGRHVVDALRSAGISVRTLSRRPLEGEHVACDLRAGAPAPEALAGCDAIVNLVGIKAGSDAEFRTAHVDVVRHLVEAARHAGVSRLVHVSVVEVPGSSTTYTKSKREGEAVARESGLDVTILRPALVVGPGDDALTNTIRGVRLAAVFPVPRPEPGRLAVVDVQDLALAVLRALERRESIGQVYDIVGPERLTMPALVDRVADALSLPTWRPSIPAWLMRPAVAILERLGPLAIVTTSQLDMLVRGLDGDGGPAARDLELHPRALATERIVELARSVGGPSLRVAPGPVQHEGLAAARPALPALRWLLPLAIGLMLLLPLVWRDVWSRMLSVEAFLAVLALYAARLPWRDLARPRARDVGTGLVVAAAMVAGAIAFVGILAGLAPDLARGVDTVLGWTRARPLALELPLLVLVATGEDIVWRAAIGLPLCARLGPVSGSLASGAAFAVAHVTSGPPILWLAALLAGTVWTALLVRTRSLAAVVVCHVAWDLAMVAILPWVLRGGLV
jgi:uncharacterized protein YbjT (DUF2867 family)/membrane protease YdiL (CAAX protease family)